MILSILSFYLLVAAKGEAVDGSKDKVQPEKQMWGLNAAGPYYEYNNATEVPVGTHLGFSAERFLLIPPGSQWSAPVELSNGAKCVYELNKDQIDDDRVTVNSGKTVRKVVPRQSTKEDTCGFADFNFTRIAKFYDVRESKIMKLCPEIKPDQKITFGCYEKISQKYGKDDLKKQDVLVFWNEIDQACSVERMNAFSKMDIELEGGNKISCQHPVDLKKLSLIDFLDSLGKAFKGITVRVPEPNVKNGELQKQKAGKLPVAL